MQFHYIFKKHVEQLNPCYIAFKWPAIHYKLAASMPVMTTPHTVVSQLVFVTIDTFLSLEGCNTFQAEAKIQPFPCGRYGS